MTKLIRIALAASLSVAVACVAQNAGIPTPGPGNDAGLLYASNFGLWSVPQGNQGQYSWSSPIFCRASADGLPLNPVFAINAPLLIKDQQPQNSEIVTPTAVSMTGASCSITVRPANPHNTFNLLSGTAGLQEAINYAAGLPYEIVLTPDWSRLGGTTGMITSAKGSTNVTILDARTSNLESCTWGGSAYACLPFGGIFTGCTNLAPGISCPAIKDTGLTNTNTGVSLAGAFPGAGGALGTGYSVCGYTQSGGTCSSAPVIHCRVLGGGVRPEIINPGICSVAPTVSVTGDGTGATVNLAIQQNSVVSSNAGLLGTQPIQGANSAATSQSTTLEDPAIIGGLLAADNGASSMDSLLAQCGASGNSNLLLANSGTQNEVALVSGCNGLYNRFGVRTTAGTFGTFDGFGIGPVNQNSSTDYAYVQENYFNQGAVQTGNVGGTGVYSFHPAVTVGGTTYSMPGAEGFNFYDSASGQLALGPGNNACSTGPGYTGTGICALTGGTLLSGTADTCTAPTSGGFSVPALSGTGVYSVPPTMNLSGFATGANYACQDVTASDVTITASLWVGPDGTIHLSTQPVGVTGFDVMNINNVGSGVFNGHVTASGGVTVGNITGLAQGVEANSSGVLQGTGSAPATGNTTSASLTTNFLPKANGANSLINSLLSDSGTSLLYTGSSGISSPAFLGTGSFPGYTAWVAGTGNIATLPANSAGWAGPPTGGTSYLFQPPATITAGVLQAAAPTTINGVLQSVVTSGLLNMSEVVGTSSSTLPVCPNGTSNALTTVGCSSGAAGTNSFFTNIPIGAATTAETAAFTTANEIFLWPIYIPAPGNAGETFIQYDVNAADNTTNLNDIGIYGPGCTNGATGVPLAADMGATLGTSMANTTGRFHRALQVTASLAAGWYCGAVTSNSATSALILGGNPTPNYAPFAVNAIAAQTSTGGALPSTITAPPAAGTATSPAVFTAFTNF
jgi:hypothetical protein